ncbi:MAG TPA: sulfotransferase, partial [Candidatus Binatia bacterium]|nr:sulfotransferase [Candidatus Binatia bacterium]
MSFRRKLELIGFYTTSLLQNRRNAEFFNGIQTYCMFVGYPRTGHSLIGSLLDAHPRVVIAHELHALRFFYWGFSRRQVFHLLLENSRKMATKGRGHSGYSYSVPNQWQGRFEQLQVLGDKSGQASARGFHFHPDLLDFLRNKIAIDLKFIHVIRNPYDVLATMSRRSPHKALDKHIDRFFQLCSGVARLKSQNQDLHIYDLRLESFIEDPKSGLAGLCSFLGIKAEASYLEDCASIVFPSPKKSRFDIEWSREAIAKVCERMEAFNFLSGYGYEEEETGPAATQGARPKKSLEILTTGKWQLSMAASTM